MISAPVNAPTTQTAKCFLQTHPIMPFPVLMLDVVALDVEARQRLASTPAGLRLTARGKAGDWTPVLRPSALTAKVR